MKSELRNLLKESIAEAMRLDRLIELYELLNLLKPLVKSKEDAMFGHVVSRLWKTSLEYAYSKDRTFLKDDEKKELLKFIRRRAKGIRLKISSTVPQ